MVGGSATKYGNTVIDSVFDCVNSDGSVYGNLVTSGSVYNTNILTGATTVANNTMHGATVVSSVIVSFTNNFVTGIILGCYVSSFASNEVVGAGYVETVGAFGLNVALFNLNKVYGTISGVTPATNSTMTGNVIGEQCDISGFTFSGTGGLFAYNSLVNDSSISNSAIIGGATIKGLSLTGSTLKIGNTTNANDYLYLSIVNSAIELTSSLAAGVDAFSNISFNNSSVIWTATAACSKVAFNGCTITPTAMLATITNSTINNFNFTTLVTVTWNLADNIVEGGISSNAVKTLDLDSAGRFASNTITFGNDDIIYGTFKLTGTGAKNITDLVAPPVFKNVFIADSAQVFTFTTTGRATVAGTKIAGSAASFALTKTGATNAADQVVIEKINSVNTITSSNILV